MNAIAILKKEFSQAIVHFNNSPAIAALASGELGIAHYKSILREIYHYAREDPQIQALATVYFRGKDREFVRQFLKHATMEIGHDLMALDDLKNLGEDVSSIPSSNPLPTTVGLISFPFYQINYLNPIGYLGYLYFLEYMPTQQGASYGAALVKAGVPQSAMSFLNEHMTVDVGHNKLMEGYLQTLVRNQADLDAVIYAMRATACLYAQMLLGAIQQADDRADYGVAMHELNRLQSVPAHLAGAH